MAENEKNLQAEVEEDDNIIILTDEDGNDVEFELLDLIKYSEKDYAVLIPADEDTDEVIIFEVIDADKEDNTFIEVEDDSLAEAVFQLFCTKNADRFDFGE